MNRPERGSWRLSLLTLALVAIAVETVAGWHGWILPTVFGALLIAGLGDN